MEVEDMWMPRPAIALSIVAGATILTTAAMHVSWIIGAPLMAVLCAILYWSAVCVKKSGVVPQHRCEVFAVTAPLTLTAVISTGLAHTRGWEFAIPPFVVSSYSITLMLVALYPQRDGVMKIANRVTSILCYIMATASVAGLFLTASHFPEFFATALLTTIFGSVALLITEFYSSMVFGCIRVSYFLHLILMACFGIFIVLENSKSVINVGFVLILITLFLSMALGIRYSSDIFDQDISMFQKAIPAVKRTQSLVAILITILVFMASFTHLAGLITCFHFIHKTTPISIPIIFVSLDGLHLLALYICWQFRAKIRYGLTTIILLLLCVYLFTVSIYLKNKENDGWLAVIIAAAITTVFFIYFGTCFYFGIPVNCIRPARQPVVLQNPRPAAHVAVRNAVVAAPVVNRNNDSDYESVASEDDW